MNEPPKYHGDGERHYEPIADDAHNRQESYRAGEELVEAVNAALFLRRPLLVEGDPGAGKTRLAYAVAWELGWPLHTCYVRSSSRAEHLLYRFDQLARLYDIQAACHMPGGAVVPKAKETFRHFQPLGEAIRDAAEGRPSVVLIDEIDKGDIDFPNDLLQVLDEYRFEIPENDDEAGQPESIDALYDPKAGIRRTVAERRDSLPLVIVTSNREKELPAAFLRRCLYCFIHFPDEDGLRGIAESHSKEKTITPLFQAALARFMELRGAAPWRKPPGTSEMLDWLRLLEREQCSRNWLKEVVLQELPHVSALIKTGEDLDILAGLKPKAQAD